METLLLFTNFGKNVEDEFHFTMIPPLYAKERMQVYSFAEERYPQYIKSDFKRH